MTHCPCGSGALYAECCEPIINQKSAPTALTLMKSRYTAYCIGDADYLYNTVKFENRKQYNRKEIAQWSEENTWLRLEIIRIENGEIDQNTGTVEFKAYYKDARGQEHIHHEISSFFKENGSWFYRDGQFVPQKSLSSSITTRNELCSCDSGKKYKKCCLLMH